MGSGVFPASMGCGPHPTTSSIPDPRLSTHGGGRGGGDYTNLQTLGTQMSIHLGALPSASRWSQAPQCPWASSAVSVENRTGDSSSKPAPPMPTPQLGPCSVAGGGNPGGGGSQGQVPCSFQLSAWKHGRVLKRSSCRPTLPPPRQSSHTLLQGAGTSNLAGGGGDEEALEQAPLSAMSLLDVKSRSCCVVTVSPGCVQKMLRWEGTDCTCVQGPAFLDLEQLAPHFRSSPVHSHRSSGRLSRSPMSLVGDYVHGFMCRGAVCSVEPGSFDGLGALGGPSPGSPQVCVSLHCHCTPWLPG